MDCLSSPRKASSASIAMADLLLPDRFDSFSSQAISEEFNLTERVFIEEILLADKNYIN
jgi:hypothetical protein